MSRKTTVHLMDVNIDLLRVPVHIACDAINMWLRASSVFTKEDFRKMFAECEPAWLIARDRLIALRRVSVDKHGHITPIKKKKGAKAA